MTNRYDNPHDVNMRIGSSIVRYKGDPVYCKGPVDDTTNVSIVRDLDKGGNFIVDANDPFLDVNIPRLGWVNLPAFPMYVTRQINNSQRQGLSVQSLQCFAPHLDDPWNIHYQFGDLPHLKPLFKTIKGEFPKLEEALAHTTGCAFHRNWAVLNRGNAHTLFHKTLDVAWYNKHTRTFNFIPDSLTKTRRMEIEDILSEYGGKYAISG